jgi:hypothetical protein
MYVCCHQVRVIKILSFACVCVCVLQDLAYLSRMADLRWPSK